MYLFDFNNQCYLLCFFDVLRLILYIRH